jgi:protein-disulfide isomerase
LSLSAVTGPSYASTDEDTIAVLNGRQITREEVEQRVATRLYRLRWEIFDTLNKETSALVDDLLLKEEAKRRGVSSEELLKMEVDDKTRPPTKEEVDAYIAEHNIGQSAGADMRSRIVTYLTDTDRIQKKIDFLTKLREKADYRFLLEPPPRPRTRISADDDPVRGSPDAPVTIIHFASFSCELCAESAQKIMQLNEEFPGLIRWVHRDFVNLFDERALRAAEAADTAYDAGHFWEFHDYMYSLSGNSEKEDIDRVLNAIGVDPALYHQAHDSAKYILEIKHDIEDGVRAGVTSVPVIFVNGRYFSGTFPYEDLRKMVVEELESAGIKPERGGKSPE